MMRIGITASAFDMLHAGHITMLQEARSVCDHLVCCIHVDPSVERRQKAPPRQPLHERCVQLQAVRYVDRIIPYQTEADLEAIIQLLVPAVRIIGEEYKHTNFTGRDLCKNLGVDIFYNKRRHGLSSSLQRLREMKCRYIFDVDGTLTPSREKIDETFRGWFSDFCDHNAVHLVTGSDYSKTKEQLGKALILRPVSVYACSGNEVWARGERIHSREWQLPEDLRSTLLAWAEASGFERKTGCHIEDRQGAVNFSVVGRNANRSERSAYMVWDAKTEERGRMARRINSLYPDLHASVGGETGIDIYPRGHDKSQILADFSVADIIYFFGDRMDTMGNDYPLSSKLKEPSKSFHVTDWRHTLEILKELGAQQ